MKRYLMAYSLWLAGVLSAAAVAYFFYRRVLAIGAEELERELDGEESARRRNGSSLDDGAASAAEGASELHEA